MPEFTSGGATAAQFNLLIEELLQGALRRGKYRPWEIDIILDIESANLRDSAKREALVEYQTSVQAELAAGAQLPLKFSEYIRLRKAPAAQRKPAKRVSNPMVKPKTRTK
jgi:hypothetical protein